jgi:hypothetical protein
MWFVVCGATRIGGPRWWSTGGSGTTSVATAAKAPSSALPNITWTTSPKSTEGPIPTRPAGERTNSASRLTRLRLRRLGLTGFARHVARFPQSRGDSEPGKDPDLQDQPHAHNKNGNDQITKLHQSPPTCRSDRRAPLTGIVSAPRRRPRDARRDCGRATCAFHRHLRSYHLVG